MAHLRPVRAGPFASSPPRWSARRWRSGRLAGGHCGPWGPKLEPDALNPCRYRAFVGDCVRFSGNVAVLFPCRIGTKPENAGTIEGEEERLSVWRVVNDDRLQTKFDCALFQRKTAVPKDERSDTALSPSSSCVQRVGGDAIEQS
jgi:hypothetical protein